MTTTGLVDLSPAIAALTAAWNPPPAPTPVRDADEDEEWDELTARGEIVEVPNARLIVPGAVADR